MKKRFEIIVLLIALSIGFLVACGENTTEGNEFSQNMSGDSAEKSEDRTEAETGTTLAEDTEQTLEDIESFLLDKGVLSGDRTKMAAEMVGGVDGFKYGDSGVEIYEYDVNSEEYIALSNGEEIPLQGMTGYMVGAVSVNGKFVLMGEPSQEAIDAFNSFK